MRVVPDMFCPLTSEVLVFELGGAVWVEAAVPGREPAPGGCGKELTLIVLRTVFSGRIDVDFEKEEDDLNVGRLGVDNDCWVVGNADGRGLEGDPSFGGLCRSVMIFDGPVGTGRLFLGGLFAVGIGGKADVGGPKIGGDRCGRADAIVADITLHSSRGWVRLSREQGQRLPARKILARPCDIAFAQRKVL